MRRWLTQLLVTERVIAYEAAAAGSALPALLRGGGAARYDRTPGDRQHRRRALGDPLARALYAHVTADVDVDSDAVADYHRRNPGRFRSDADLADHLRGGPSARLPDLAGAAPRRTGGWRRLRAPRRPAPARQHPQAPMGTLALDIGGTKIAAGIVDADGRLLHHNRQPTPRSADPMTWAAARRTIDEALAAAGGEVSGVGISSAGPIHLPGGTVSPVNIGAWRGFRSCSVAAAVPGVPVRLAGDGLCMALGEQWRARGRTRRSCWAWWCRPGRRRPGLGGRRTAGAPATRGTSGMWWSRSTVRRAAAGTGLRRGHRQRAEPGLLGAFAGLVGEDAKALVTAAADGNPLALRAFAAVRGRRRDDLSVAAVCDLDLVVIGGEWPTPARCSSSPCMRPW